MTHKDQTILNRRDFLKKSAVSAAAIATPLTSSLWLSGCGKQRQRGAKPNVVVTLIDTLRPDYLGFYGYKKETARFLAKMAKKSAVFMRAFATSSWTAPSTASLFTSKYPHQHGVIEGFYCHKFRMEELERTGKAKIALNSIPTDLPTLPEIFKSMGYTTFGFGANINIGDEIGFNRGFDQFERSTDAPASVLYERMQQWKEKIQKAKPFFLYLHPNDVHDPYNKHQSYYEEQKDPREDAKARYLSEIGYVDEYLGKIYETLSLDDNTISVVTSDHGEEFWDHGDDGHRPKLYRELTQVLMLFYAPFLGIMPERVDINVSIIDILPTLVELVGGRPIQGLEGTSLAPMLTATSFVAVLAGKLHNRTLFANRITTKPEQQIWAAIHQHWNLVEHWESPKQLFDHRYDPKELRNVILKYPYITSQLVAQLQKVKKAGQWEKAGKVQVDLDEKLLETLKSLGYAE